MDECEIFPNWSVLISIVGRESEEKVTLKPLILTPLRKSPTIALHWDFIGSSFCIRVLDIISKLKKKIGHLGQDVDQVLYSAMGGRQCENKQHGDTVPEKV